MKKNYLRAVSALISLLIVLGACFIPLSGSDRQTHIVSCMLSEDGNTLTVDVTLSDDFLTVYGACGVYLFELPPYAKMSNINNYSPAAELVAQSDITFTLDMTDCAPERIYNKFVIARLVDGEYQTTANVKYIDNPQVFAGNKKDYPKFDGKEGVYGDSDGAATIDAKSAVIPVALNTLVMDTIEGSTKYEFGDKTYYINKENLIALDNNVRALSENGREAVLQLLLTKPDETTSETAMKLYQYIKASDAVYYGVNTENDESISVYTALLKFLCERYTRDDAVYGFAGKFIMGAALNSNRVYNSVGHTMDSKYIIALTRQLHIVSTALLSEYSEAKLLLPFEANFNHPVHDPALNPNEYLDYSAKYVLDSVFESLETGDCNVPFGIYLDATASDGSYDFWNDEYAEDSQDSPFVTIKNINVLTDYLKTPTLLYNGYMREVSVAFDTGDNTADNAAAALCAYYCAKANDDISMIYFDGVTNGTVSDSLHSLDSLSDAEIKNKIKLLLGEQGYSELVDGSLADLLVNRIDMPLFTDKLSGRSKVTKIADFTDNDIGAFCADHYTSSCAISIDGDAGLSLSAEGNADRAGFYRTFDEYVISGQDVVAICINAVSETDEATVRLILRGKKGDEDVVLSGQSVVTPGEWNEIRFSLSGIDTLNYLGISAASVNGEAMTLMCKDIMMYRLPMLGLRLVITVIIWIIAIFLFLFLLIYGRIVYIKAKKGKKKRKELSEKLKKEDEKHRRAQQARDSRHADKNTSKKNAERAQKEKKEQQRRAKEREEAQKRKTDKERQAAQRAQKQKQTERPQSVKPTPKTEPVSAPKNARPAEKTSAKKADIPEMPKTEPKTYMVPQKKETVRKRSTMSVGIEPSGGNMGESFDTTSLSKKNFS